MSHEADQSSKEALPNQVCPIYRVAITEKASHIFKDTLFTQANLRKENAQISEVNLIKQADHHA